MNARPNGFWCDVFPHPEGLGWAWCTGAEIGDCPIVVVEINGIERFRTTAPDTPRYLRAAANPAGEVCFVGQAQGGGGLLVYLEGAWRFGPAPDGWPCYAVPAVRWDGRQFVIYTQVTDTQYATIAGGVMSQAVPIPIGGTSAGFAQVTSPDGLAELIQWAQDTRQRTIRGLTLYVTMEYAGIVTGQYETPSGAFQVAAGIGLGAGDPFTALEAPAMDPRLAYSPERQRWACCSWTTANRACYSEFPPAEPLPVDPPVPPEPPEPEPPEPPKPEPPKPEPPHPPAPDIPRARPLKKGLSMDPVIGYVIGPNSQYGRIHPDNPKYLLFDGTGPDVAYEAELSKPDARFKVRMLHGAGRVPDADPPDTADREIVSLIPLSDPNLDPSKVFEMRAERGGWESPEAYYLADDTIEILGRYEQDGRKYYSVPLRFIEKPKAA